MLFSRHFKLTIFFVLPIIAVLIFGGVFVYKNKSYGATVLSCSVSGSGSNTLLTALGLFGTISAATWNSSNNRVQITDENGASASVTCTQTGGTLTDIPNGDIFSSLTSSNASEAIFTFAGSSTGQAEQARRGESGQAASSGVPSSTGEITVIKFLYGAVYDSVSNTLDVTGANFSFNTQDVKSNFSLQNNGQKSNIAADKVTIFSNTQAKISLDGLSGFLINEKLAPGNYILNLFVPGQKEQPSTEFTVEEFDKNPPDLLLEQAVSFAKPSIGGPDIRTAPTVFDFGELKIKATEEKEKDSGMGIVQLFDFDYDGSFGVTAPPGSSIENQTIGGGGGTSLVIREAITDVSQQPQACLGYLCALGAPTGSVPIPPVVEFTKSSPLTISLNLAGYGRMDVLTPSGSVIFSNAVGPNMSPISIPNTENGTFIIRLYDNGNVVFEFTAITEGGKLVSLESTNFPVENKMLNIVRTEGVRTFTVTAQDRAGNISISSLSFVPAKEEVIIEVEEVQEAEEDIIVELFEEEEEAVDLTFFLRRPEPDLSFTLTKARDLNFWLEKKGEVAFEDIFSIDIEDSVPPGEEQIFEGGEPPFEISFVDEGIISPEAVSSPVDQVNVSIEELDGMAVTGETAGESLIEVIIEEVDVGVGRGDSGVRVEIFEEPISGTEPAAGESPTTVEAPSGIVETVYQAVYDAFASLFGGAPSEVTPPAEVPLVPSEMAVPSSPAPESPTLSPTSPSLSGVGAPIVAAPAPMAPSAEEGGVSSMAESSSGVGSPTQSEPVPVEMVGLSLGGPSENVPSAPVAIPVVESPTTILPLGEGEEGGVSSPPASAAPADGGLVGAFIDAIGELFGIAPVPEPAIGAPVVVAPVAPIAPAPIVVAPAPADGGLVGAFIDAIGELFGIAPVPEPAPVAVAPVPAGIDGGVAPAIPVVGAPIVGAPAIPAVAPAGGGLMVPPAEAPIGAPAAGGIPAIGGGIAPAPVGGGFAAPSGGAVGVVPAPVAGGGPIVGAPLAPEVPVLVSAIPGSGGGGGGSPITIKSGGGTPSAAQRPSGGGREESELRDTLQKLYKQVYEAALKLFGIYKKRVESRYPIGHDVNVSAGWVSYKGDKANWPANHMVEYSKSWVGLSAQKTFNWPRNHHVAASNLGNFKK